MSARKQSSNGLSAMNSTATKKSAIVTPKQPMTAAAKVSQQQQQRSLSESHLNGYNVRKASATAPEVNSPALIYSSSSNSSIDSLEVKVKKELKINSSAVNERPFRYCDRYGFYIDNEEQLKRRHSSISSSASTYRNRKFENNSETSMSSSSSTPPPSKIKSKVNSSSTPSSPSSDAAQREIMAKVFRREKKWLSMIKHWDKYMTYHWKLLRDRCRKGIPIAVRGRAWFFLCAGFKQKARYSDLFLRLDGELGNEKINDEIKKDLNRQFPNHEMFASVNSTGQEDLYRILKAFSIIKPDIGYCQGQAPIASVLLMQMPAEDAFWSLVQICDHYIPGYFSPGLEALQIHARVLNALIKRFFPPIYKHLKKQSIDPVLYMTEWFMCLFTRTLPWSSVLRLLDMFFCEGIIVIFKAALVLISKCLREESDRRACPTMYETLQLLRHLPERYTNEEYLIIRVIQFELTIKDLEKEKIKQIIKRRKELLKTKSK